MLCVITRCVITCYIKINNYLLKNYCSLLSDLSSRIALEKYLPRWEHPRWCGEKHNACEKIFLDKGSPPQVRGKDYFFNSTLIRPTRRSIISKRYSMRSSLDFLSTITPPNIKKVATRVATFYNLKFYILTFCKKYDILLLRELGRLQLLGSAGRVFPHSIGFFIISHIFQFVKKIFQALCSECRQKNIAASAYRAEWKMGTQEP